MVRFDVRKFAILLLLASTAAQAQLWSGPAAVEVQVEDQKGAAVAGAELKMQFKGVDPKDGPSPVTTDNRGRVTVTGLAEGPWQLEVSREGFMTYIAEVNVRTKGRPTLEEALVLASSGALRTMKVRITRGKPAPAPVREPEVAEKPAPAPRPAAPRKTEPRPQIQPEPEPAPSPRETPPAPSAPPAPIPEKTPAPAPAPPAPQAAPQPAPKPETPPTPKAEPKPVPTPAPPVPQPKPQPATPQAPPAPPVRQPTVRPEPEKTPPTIPPVQPVRMRSARERNCPDCQPGESAMSTEAVVTSGGSGCGSITSALKGGAVGELPAGCHVLKVTLPAGAKYSGYRYEIQDGRDSFDCAAGRDCTGSSGRWPVDPVVVKNPGGTVVLAPFEARAEGRERRAVLTVYFKGK